jgi:hypothetical protein
MIFGLLSQTNLAQNDVLQVGLLMESLSSCIFLSQLPSCLIKTSDFSLRSIVSSRSEILSSTCSSLL